MKVKAEMNSGVTYGFKTLLALDIPNKKGIVILTNSTDLLGKEYKILSKVGLKYLED